MRNYKYILLVVFVFLLLGNITYAQTGNSNENKNRANNTAVANENNQTSEKLDGKKLEALTKVFSNQSRKVISRLDATIQRLESIMVKTSSRIEKIRNAGGKTDTAEKYVVEAKASLEKAKLTLESMKNTVATNPSETLKAMKEVAKGIETDLQLVHKSLEKAVGSLKGLSQTAPNNSSN